MGFVTDTAEAGTSHDCIARSFYIGAYRSRIAWRGGLGRSAWVLRALATVGGRDVEHGAGNVAFVDRERARGGP